MVSYKAFPKFLTNTIMDGLLIKAPFDLQSNNPEDSIGYTYQLFRRSNSVYAGYLKLAERIVNFVNRNGGEAKIINEKWFTDKEHRKPFWKHDYMLIVIFDPVANEIDKLCEIRDLEKAKPTVSYKSYNYKGAIN